MGCRSVWKKALGIEDKQAVYAVGQDLVFYLAFDAGSGHDSLQLHAQLVGQLAAFGQQFLGHLLHGGSLYFAIYKYVVHVFVVKW